MEVLDGTLMKNQSYSYIFDEIVQRIEPGSSVLDLGCGEGELLYRLKRDRNVHGTGVDIEESMILKCIQKGISVFQGNLDEGLKDYMSGSYDYVILSQVLQVVHDPVFLLEEMLRVGKKVIINFPNFGFLPIRLTLLFSGRMPNTKTLPYMWYNTPNIHLCTRKDFHNLCKEMKVKILEEMSFRNNRRIPTFLQNSLATDCCFILERNPA